MTKNVETEAPPIPSKEEIIEKVIDIFIDEIGVIERYEVSKDTNIVKDFKIDTDDLSCFLESALDYFRIPGGQLDYYPNTIERISDHIFNYLSSGKPLADPRDRRSIWEKFVQWMNRRKGD
jgi:hypothetical protein